MKIKTLFIVLILIISRSSLCDIVISFDDFEEGKIHKIIALGLNPQSFQNNNGQENKLSNEISFIQDGDATSLLKPTSLFLIRKYFTGDIIKSATIDLDDISESFKTFISIKNVNVIDYELTSYSEYLPLFDSFRIYWNHVEKFVLKYEQIEWIISDYEYDESNGNYNPITYKWGWDFTKQKPIDYDSSVQNYSLH